MRFSSTYLNRKTDLFSIFFSPIFLRLEIKPKSAKPTWMCTRCSCRWRCSFIYYFMYRCHSMRSAPNSKRCSQYRRSFIGRRYFYLMRQFMPCTRTSCTPFTFGVIFIIYSRQKNMVWLAFHSNRSRINRYHFSTAIGIEPKLLFSPFVSLDFQWCFCPSTWCTVSAIFQSFIF